MYRSERHFGLDARGDDFPERSMPGYYIRVPGDRSESMGQEFDSSRLDSEGRSLLTLFVVAVVLAAAVLGVALFAVFSSEQHASAPSITVGQKEQS